MSFFKKSREKLFGYGKPRPLDRNAKARIMALARVKMGRTEKGRAYGEISAKAFAVLQALLWKFHNAKSGWCFPSYEKIAERAGCARSTVAEAIKQLEAAGLLTWVHRIKRIRERCKDFLGNGDARVRVVRTSNAYHFRDPQPAIAEVAAALPSKSESPTRTIIQDFSYTQKNEKGSDFVNPTLKNALQKLKMAIQAASLPKIEEKLSEIAF